MLKRIISLILSAVIIASCFGVAVTATERDYERENVCLELLTDLGITDGSKNATPDVYLTRADAAKMFAEIFKLDGYVGKQIFSDVTDKVDCFDAVSLLCDLGVISIDDTFRPDELITMDEFVTMTVNAIGCGIPAKENGGYPTGYITIARREGILQEIFWDNDGVMLSQAAVMISNLMECEVNKYGMLGDFFTGGKSLLEYIFKAYKASGIITDNGVTALTDKTAIEEGQIIIDGVKYYAPTEAEELLGYYVEVYYKHNSGTNKNEIIAIAPVSGMNTVTSISYDEISYSDGIYTYYDGDRKNAINIQPDTAIIYNGQAITSEQFSNSTKFSMVPTYGTVDILCNSGANIVDVVFINNYTNMLAKKYYKEDNVIICYGQPSLVELEDKEYRIFDKDGNRVKTEDLTDKTPMLVAQSLDGEFVKIIAGGEAINGSISTISGDGTEREYRIGEGLFKSTPTFSKTLRLGSSGIFYIDAFGNICYFDLISNSSDIYGYVIDVQAKKTGFVNNIIVKIHTQFDMTQDLNIADSIKFDDETYKKDKDADTIISKLQACKDKVVMFSQNVKGDITMIDSSNDLNKEGFHIEEGMDGSAPVLYYTDTKTFGGRVVCDDNTIFFMVPENGSEDNYLACNLAAFSTIDTRVAVEREGIQIYTYGENTIKASAVVQKNAYTGSLPSVGKLHIVEEVSQSLNSDGMPCYQLSTTMRGSSGTYNTEDLGVYNNVKINGKPYKIGKGDLITFGCNRDKEITYDGSGETSIKVLYSAKQRYFETDKTINTAYSTSYNASDNFKQIYIYDSTDMDGYYKCTFTKPSIDTKPSDIFVYKLSSFSTVFNYNSERNIVSRGSINSLKTYMEMGDECSECVFFAYDFDFDTNYAMLVIYE